MKKLFFFLLIWSVTSYANGQTPVVSIQQVEMSALKTAPLGSYCFMTQAEFNNLLKEGYETEHGMENHEFGFNGETTKYWVSHPDGFIAKKDLVFTYEFTNDGKKASIGPVRIIVPYGTVMIFKKGSYTFANSLAYENAGWWSSVDIAE